MFYPATEAMAIRRYCERICSRDPLIKKSSLVSLIAMANALTALISGRALIEHLKQMPTSTNYIYLTGRRM